MTLLKRGCANSGVGLELAEVLSQKYCRTKGRRTAVQIEVTVQHKCGVCCGVSLSSRLRSQEGTAIQMGGAVQIGDVLHYLLGKLERLGGFPNIAHLS